MESSRSLDASADSASVLRGGAFIRASYRGFQEAVFTRGPGFALLELEPTTRCGARCAYCPRDRLARPGGEMALETARRIAAAAASSPPRAVLLSGFGEPLLHPDLPGIVRELRAPLAALIGVVTNGEGLSAARAEALIDAGIDFFHVSVPAATAATAGALAPGLDFAAAERNLTALLARAAGRIPVAVNFVVTAANRAEKAAVERTWRARGAWAVYAGPVHNRDGFLAPETPTAAAARGDCWVYEHCLFAAWDGRVLACCHDLAGAEDYGNLARDTLAAVRAHRQARLRYTLAGIMCRRCDFYLA
ncbi:MAG: radical SAM protein [Planctomycetes bacterium]|nr:radical SAM protein [Planctomycetota bacterium]